MTGLLHDLSDWVIGFASSDWAVVALGITSFAESIFFPIPPDLLLIGMGLIQPHLALWFAAVATLSSVAGAIVGHWLGMRLGRPLADRLFPERWIDLAERLLRRYGVWATLIAAFTPVPYKVFAISAGVLALDRRTFIVASLVGRGVRFTLIGALILFFGDAIESFLVDNFEVLTVAVGVAAVVAAVGLVFAHRRGRTRDVVG